MGRQALLLGILLAVFGATPAQAMKKLEISNLPFHTDVAKVLEVVSVYGEVMDVEVTAVDENGIQSARALVRFFDPAAVDAAVLELDGAPCWDGSLLAARSKDVLLIGSLIVAIVREEGLRLDREAFDDLNDRVHALLERAIERARVNGRGALITQLDFDVVPDERQVDGPVDEVTLSTDRTSKPKEIVVVGSKVKEVIREAGLRSDGELVQAVSDKVHELVGAAIKRAKGNGRQTVRPIDL